MNKLHSLAFYALITPVLTLGAGSVLAQQSSGQDVDREQQSTQRDQDATQSTPRTTQGDQSTQRAGQSDSRTAADHQNKGDQSRMQNRGHMDSAPANGMQASDLIGAEVKTTSDENVGSVSDLIVDENGQIVAIVVGVDGFLGMSQRDVAIGWEAVTRSGTSDELEVQVDVTGEDLRSAPKFERQD